MSDFNPYEPPKTSTAEFLQFHSQGIKRYGKNGLFVPIGMDLPARCIYCNQPVTDKSVKRTYTDDKIYPFIFLIVGIVLLVLFRSLEFLVFAIIGSIILSVFTYRKASIHIGLCHYHKRKRLKRGVFFVLLAFASFGLVLLINIFNLPEIFQLLAVFTFWIAILGVSFNSHLISKIKIDKTGCYLKGFGKEFLRSFE